MEALPQLLQTNVHLPVPDDPTAVDVFCRFGSARRHALRKVSARQSSD
jgi:hypothetical protein